MSVNQEAEPIRVEPGKIAKKCDVWEKGERSDKQKSATRREAIKSFVEDAGLHAKAFNQFRAIRKIEDEGKRMHAVRTMEALLPLLRAELEGNELPLDEPQDNVVTMQNAAQAADAEMDELDADAADFDDAAGQIDLSQPDTVAAAE